MFIIWTNVKQIRWLYCLYCHKFVASLPSRRIFHRRLVKATSIDR